MFAFTKHSSGRVALIVLVGLLVLSGYFISHTYLNRISTVQNHQLDKLYTIAKTVAAQVDGDDIEYLNERYRKQDAISSTEDDLVYTLLHNQLKRAYLSNELQSPIYTLFEGNSDKVYFGITSSEKPYFRHEYSSKPAEILKFYKRGGMIDQYEDEHGMWLSAFAPIKNSVGKVVSILQVDQPFDIFLSKARTDLYKNIAISVLIFLVIGYVIFNLTIRTLRKDDLVKEKLKFKNNLIEEKNKSITASINYARKLQLAFKPNEEKLRSSFREFFSINLPKDIVTGDFFWFHEDPVSGDRILVLADCTGHGVPGAMMSILGHSLLNEIVTQLHQTSPKEILYWLDKRLAQTLAAEDGETVRDGMDISVLSIDKEEKLLRYCGANQSAIIIRQGKRKVLKGNRMAVGEFNGRNIISQESLKLEKDDSIYLFSDGFRDQFGGPKEKKFRSKNFLEMIEKYSCESMSVQKDVYMHIFSEWKGHHEQVDDVSLVGIRI